MKLTQITAVALALLVVGAGAVAAIPGQAADQAQDRTNDSASDAVDRGPVDVDEPDVPDASDAAANASDAGADASENASDRRGPPVDMPDPVPDHVSQIHETITSWFDGGKEGSLGDAISDIVGGGDAAEEPDDDEENRTATPADTESDA